MRRSISNTETAITEPRRCSCLSCDLCAGHEECTPLPKRLATISKQDDANARRLAIIEAQERLLIGI